MPQKGSQPLPLSDPRTRSNRPRIAAAALLVFAISLALAWLFIPTRDPLFHGKSESWWIENLSYNDDEQVRQWREFGPDGVPVLVRALDEANRPVDGIYRSAYRRIGRILPVGFMRVLPAPRMDLTRASRMKLVSLLAHLGRDAMPATPVMIRELRDEDSSVRQLAITFFTQGEDANTPLNQMDEGSKRKLLPEFIRAMQDRQPGVRNNAVVALRYYPEQAHVVVPALTKALHDPDARVRQLATNALQGFKPATESKDALK